MGNCFSGCEGRSRGLSGTSDDVGNFERLVENSASSDEKRSFLIRLFGKRKDKKRSVLRLVDGLRMAPPLGYGRLSESQQLSSLASSSSKDIQLQCLDVRALLHRNSLSTVGSSSLDLEWDNETLPESVMVARDPSWSSWTTLHEDLSGLPGRKSGIRCRSNADSDRSGVSSSSADSLEWDDVQQSLENVDAVTTELDSETRTLLVEIERLTNRTLEETGRGLMGC
ncbi:unnamed protein product [Phyllotreta striolata]|uniref:Uncharacterized protein n=1 Tax=Phyllotreta striolata TaxID=444603 RepID=A0A9P0DTG2_PHYSR|nr:unnamed protein product [Phyllotreta striolata]